MEQIFKDNPKLDEVYQTSDGKFFYLENDARNHAFKLENKKVMKLIRPLNTGDKKEIDGVEKIEGEKEIESAGDEEKIKNSNLLSNLPPEKTKRK